MIKLSTNAWIIENVDTILFDKDGTFIDLHYFWGKMTELRVEEIIRVFNLSKNLMPELCLYLGYDSDKRQMLSNGITAMYSRTKIIEIFADDLKKLGVKTSQKELENIFDKVSEIFYKEIEIYTKPISEAVDFINKVKKLGIKTGIVTSDSIKSTELTIKQFGWEQLFDVVIGRESTNSSKESGEGTKLALEKLNSLPSNTIMIGDAPMDYISAQNAGIKKTILVATGQISQKELSKTSQFTTDNLKDVNVTIC